MSYLLESHRDEKYLKFIRTRPCVVTGYEGKSIVVAHHVRCLGGGGMGLKPSDYLCVPLLVEEHNKLHHIGERSYWKEQGIDPEEMITMSLLVYFAQIRVNYVDLIKLISSQNK